MKDFPWDVAIAVVAIVAGTIYTAKMIYAGLFAGASLFRAIVSMGAFRG